MRSETTPAPRPRVVLVDGVPMSALVADGAGPDGRHRCGPRRGHHRRRISTAPVIRDCPCCVGAAPGSPWWRWTGRATAVRPRIPTRWPIPDSGSSWPMERSTRSSARVPRRRAFPARSFRRLRLALRMAADERGDDLSGSHWPGRGCTMTMPRPGVLKTATPTKRPAGLRELLWEPAHLYPAEVLTGIATRRPGAPYEAAMVNHLGAAGLSGTGWRVRVPVHSASPNTNEYGSPTPEALAEIASTFTASPRL